MCDKGIGPLSHFVCVDRQARAVIRMGDRQARAAGRVLCRLRVDRSLQDILAVGRGVYVRSLFLNSV